MIVRLFSFVVISMMLASVASAQTLHHSSRYWRVLTVEQHGARTCYMVSNPISKTGNYKKRGEPFVMVTYGRTNDEVSVSSGYPYHEKKDVELRIDGVKSPLFVNGERAWARDAATDATLVKRMIKGSKMVVHGTSRIGTYSKDSYSLSGFTAARNKMRALCSR